MSEKISTQNYHKDGLNYNVETFIDEAPTEQNYLTFNVPPDLKVLYSVESETNMPVVLCYGAPSFMNELFGNFKSSSNTFLVDVVEYMSVLDQFLKSSENESTEKI